MDENVVYCPKAKQFGEGFALLERATVLLREILDGAWGQVQAEWDRQEDEDGRSVYTLKLRDFSGEAEARFLPEELARPIHMRFVLSRLWGNLLRVRNRRQIQQLREAGAVED